MKTEYTPAKLEIIKLSFADIVTDFKEGYNSSGNTTEIMHTKKNATSFLITRNGDIVDPFERTN